MSEKITLSRPAKTREGWYVSVRGNDEHFLHTDGVVRLSTMSNGKWTGYHATEAEALAAIAKFQKANAEVTL